MAKAKGNVSAIYMQSQVASQVESGETMDQVGSSLWYRVHTAAHQFWDLDDTIIIYDGVTPVTPTTLTPDGYALLPSTPAGAVTADFHYLACPQVGGFRSHSIKEAMATEECSCYEDGLGEQHEAVAYSGNITAEGFYTTVDSLLTTAKGANKDLTFISTILGTPGDDLSVESIVSGNNTPLSVAIATHKLTITSATDDDGDPTSTARDIRDAIRESAAASALFKVKLASGSDGSGIFGDLTETHLAGGVDITSPVKASLETAEGSNKDLKFEAQDAGVDGDDITVECLVSGNNTPLSIVVVSDAITIHSATGSGGAATSTALDIRDALNADASAFALIETSVLAGQDGSGIFGALSEEHLVGGMDDSDPDRWAETLIGIFTWDTTPYIGWRTVGRVILEKVSLKAGLKTLVGKTINMKVQVVLYDHSG